MARIAKAPGTSNIADPATPIQKSGSDQCVMFSTSAAMPAAIEVTAMQIVADNDPRAVSQPNAPLTAEAPINQIAERCPGFAECAMIDTKRNTTARTRGTNAAARTERMSATLGVRSTIEASTRSPTPAPAYRASASPGARNCQESGVPPPADHSLEIFWRPALICPRLTFESTRRRRDPRVGLVGRRCGGTEAASSTSFWSRASASSRFLS